MAIEKGINGYTEQGYFTEGGVDGPVERATSPAHPIMPKVWSEILNQKKSGQPGGKFYTVQQDLGEAHLMSVFDGPDGDINAKSLEQGLESMPPVDKVAIDPYDLIHDITFASIMVAILLHLPLLGLFAPECTAWSKANDFNSNKPEVIARTEGKRGEQTRVMSRVRAMIRAIWSYGGHAMIENPASSQFWNQPFCEAIEEETPPTRTWREVIVNLCRVGGNHYKAM